MVDQTKKIAFIGVGAMGSALAKSAVASGVYRPEEVLVCDIVESQARKVANEIGAESEVDPAAAVRHASTVVIAVKPKDVSGLLESVRPAATFQKLFISIAAGISIRTIEGLLPEGTPVVRVMPNTPCLVGAGMSVYAVGGSAKPQHEEVVSRLFGAVGLVEKAEESLLDAVTGLSGSGPAYFFLMLEALADGGVKMGLPRPLALKLAAQTCLGAAKMVLDTGEHPAVLKDRVASPGGTTIAGLSALEEGRVRWSLIRAVELAAQRSREIGS